MSVADELELEKPAGDQAPPPPDGDGWRRHPDGYEFTPRKGRPGIIRRQGEESVDAARERDGKARQDKRPRKSKRPKMPDAPTKVDIKELEHLLAEIFTAPAMACAAFGDEWAAKHFTNQGPYLARNLVLAAERNPWLRRKLEEMATGQDAAMMLMTIVPVVGATIGYLMPPLVWWLNLPVPDRTRQMFGIPERRPDADSPTPPASPLAAAA